MIVHVILKLGEIKPLHADWRYIQSVDALEHRVSCQLGPCNVEFGQVVGVQLECPMVGNQSR